MTEMMLVAMVWAWHSINRNAIIHGGTGKITGMALTIEPSISYGDRFIMVAEENLLVHDDHIGAHNTRTT